MHGQQMFTTFVVSKDKEIIHLMFHQKILKMNDAKFRMEVAQVAKLLHQMRKMTDKSDKRIMRDFSRTIVKELIRV